ncbi:unnamed protein product [Amoebophrya sp. A120]|nr:unnamed protein product [Amoebophrya sp. A120]|eukprot:GSA120T00025191001.1
MLAANRSSLFVHLGSVCSLYSCIVFADAAGPPLAGRGGVRGRHLRPRSRSPASGTRAGGPADREVDPSSGPGPRAASALGAPEGLRHLRWVFDMPLQFVSLAGEPLPNLPEVVKPEQWLQWTPADLYRHVETQLPREILPCGKVDILLANGAATTPVPREEQGARRFLADVLREDIARRNGGRGTTSSKPQPHTLQVVIVKGKNKPFPDRQTLALAIDLWRDDRRVDFNNQQRAEARRQIVDEYGDVNEWNVCRVNNLDGIFNFARFGYHDTFQMSLWDTRGVTSMRRLFMDAPLFNQDISAWDVRDVTDLSAMFKRAASFDQDLSRWNVGRVTYMHGMFEGAVRFNQDLSTWDVRRVEDMGKMFKDAEAFNQPLAEWGKKLGQRVRGEGPRLRLCQMFRDASSFRQSLVAWEAWMLEEEAKIKQGVFGPGMPDFLALIFEDMLEGALNFIPAEHLTEKQRDLMQKGRAYGRDPIDSKGYRLMPDGTRRGYIPLS